MPVQMRRSMCSGIGCDDAESAIAGNRQTQERLNMLIKSKSLSAALAAVFMAAGAASIGATPAKAAVVYCKTAVVPQGCVVRPTPVVAPVVAPVRVAAVSAAR